MEKTFASLTPQQAAALGQSDNVVFVDPRPAAAIAETTGLITGARNVQLDDIAAHEFHKQGFAQVNYVEGGTQGWLDAGFHTSR